MPRSRSPNYPALSLPQAVERIQAVYSQQHLTPESREVVVKHMGYNSVNGRSAKSLSALIKYGLLEDQDGGFIVSGLALDILEPELEQSKADALYMAAHKPKLFADLFERYEQKPTRASLSAYLVRQGFTQKAVEAVAKSFEETFDLVNGLDGDTESGETDGENKSSAPPPNTFAQFFGRSLAGGPSGGATSLASGKENLEIKMNCTRPVFDFDTVQIVTKIDNRTSLAELMKRLEAIRSLLPEISPHDERGDSAAGADGTIS